VPTRLATLSPASEKDGAMPPARGGPPAVEVPTLVKSPTPRATTAALIRATTTTVRLGLGALARVGGAASLNAW